MPPSTATQRETFCLTLSTVYRVTVEFAHSARPGSISRRRVAAALGAGRGDDRLDVLLDRGRGLLVLGVADPEAAAEIPHGVLAEARERRRRAGEGRQLEQLRADVGVDARAASGPATRRGLLERPRRLVHREPELRVGLAGGDLLVRIAGHVRGDAHEHGLLGRGVLAGRRPPGRRRRSARAGARARRSCRSRSPRGGGAGPCAARRGTWRCRAAAAARAGSRRSAPGAARRPRRRRTTGPPAANSSSTALQGKALEANTTSSSSLPASRRPPGRPVRAPAGPPRRPRRRACRTRVPARSGRSRRPPGGRAR